MSLSYPVEFCLTDVNDLSLPMTDPTCGQDGTLDGATSQLTVRRLRGPWVDLTQVETSPWVRTPPIPVPLTGIYMFQERPTWPLTGLLTLARNSATMISPFISPPWSIYRRSCCFPFISPPWSTYRRSCHTKLRGVDAAKRRGVRPTTRFVSLWSAEFSTGVCLTGPPGSPKNPLVSALVTISLTCRYVAKCWAPNGGR